MISRRHFMKTATLGLAGTLAASCLGARAQGVPQRTPAPAAARAPRPNIVVFLADDLGFGDLACHGNPTVKTPQLDAFARDAVELTRFHVSPVCSPTRASLMTGRYNFRTGVADVFGKATIMDPAETTLAEALRAAGYATGLFGKWHLGDDPEHSPNAQGFGEALTFPGPAMPAKNYFDPVLRHNNKPEKYRGYCLDVFTDAALAFIKAHRNRPFFCYLPSNLIHTPLAVAPELTAEYDSAGLGESTAKIYGMIRNVDNNFGRVRAALRELGLEDNTLLIFFSDNGPCSGSKPFDRHMAGLRGLKGTVYENGIRTPCFARWPAGFAGAKKMERLAGHIDLLPTILEACGAPPPAGVKLDGRSLLPLLKNPAAPWPERTLFFQWDSGQVPRRGHAWTAVTERWKLVQPTGMDSPQQQHIRDSYARLCELQGRRENSSIEGPARCELYDVAADPGETRDLAAVHPEIVGKMKKEYEAWFDEVCARWDLMKRENKP